MSEKCPGCGYYTLACQCRKDDNYCEKPDCQRVISDCHCDDHNDHYRYDNDSNDKYDNDDPCHYGEDDWVGDLDGCSKKINRINEIKFIL